MDNLKKIVILSTSPRKNSNSNALAEEFAKGAKEAGNEVYDKVRRGTIGLHN